MPVEIVPSSQIYSVAHDAVRADIALCSSGKLIKDAHTCER